MMRKTKLIYISLVVIIAVVLIQTGVVKSTAEFFFNKLHMFKIEWEFEMSNWGIVAASEKGTIWVKLRKKWLLSKYAYRVEQPIDLSCEVKGDVSGLVSKNREI